MVFACRQATDQGSPNRRPRLTACAGGDPLRVAKHAERRAFGRRFGGLFLVPGVSSNSRNPSGLTPRAAAGRRDRSCIRSVASGTSQRFPCGFMGIGSRTWRSSTRMRGFCARKPEDVCTRALPRRSEQRESARLHEQNRENGWDSARKRPQTPASRGDDPHRRRTRTAFASNPTSDRGVSAVRDEVGFAHNPPALTPLSMLTQHRVGRPRRMGSRDPTCVSAAKDRSHGRAARLSRRIPPGHERHGCCPGLMKREGRAEPGFSHAELEFSRRIPPARHLCAVGGDAAGPPGG
jgi:hypothetical protein